MKKNKDNSLDEPATLLKEIRLIHESYHMSCRSIDDKGLPGLEDALLLYIIALMRGVHSPPPTISTSQQNCLISYLRHHGIKQFLFWQSQTFPEKIQPPDWLKDELKTAYLKSMRGYRKAEGQLTCIAGALTRDEIDFIVLKGTAFSRSIYPDSFVRPVSDIDILVRPVDVVRARKALESAGYNCSYPYFDISSKFFCEEEFTYGERKTGSLPVELHWDESSLSVLKRNSDVEGYIRRSLKVETGKQKILIMCAADALLSQAVHMMGKHFGSIRLAWINDIAFLCRYLETTGSWEELRSRAIETNTGPLLRPALKMAELWTGVKVPKDIYDFRSASEKSVQEAFEKLTKVKPNIVSNIKALWPTEAPLLEKLRIVSFFAIPPEQIIRTQNFPGKNMPIPVMHLKRWGDIVARNLRNQG